MRHMTDVGTGHEQAAPPWDHMADDVDRRPPIRLVFLLLLGILTFVGLDILADYQTGATTEHLLSELAIMLLCVGGMVVLWRSSLRHRARVQRLTRDVARVRLEAETWRASTEQLLGELAEAVDRQFDTWQLTAAEREIAFALLRGLSHKQIAGARNTSERTVREQARAVYQKAGLDGRSMLSAFFLRGLLPPRPTG